MAIARVQAAGFHPANAATGAATYGSAVTVGSMLIAVVNCEGSGSPGRFTDSVTDTVNGSWTKAAAALYNEGGWFGEVTLWYFANTAAGTPTVTASYTGNVATNCLVLAEYSGMPTTATVNTTATLDNDGPGTSHATGSAATTVATLLIAGFGDWGAATTYTAGGSWAKAAAFESSSSVEAALLDQGVGGAGVTAGSYTAAANTAGSTVTGDLLVAFAAGAGGTPDTLRLPIQTIRVP